MISVIEGAQGAKGQKVAGPLTDSNIVVVTTHEAIQSGPLAMVIVVIVCSPQSALSCDERRQMIFTRLLAMSLLPFSQNIDQKDHVLGK